MRIALIASLLLFASVSVPSLNATGFVRFSPAELGKACKCCRPCYALSYEVVLTGDLDAEGAAAKVQALLEVIEGVDTITIDGKTATLKMAMGYSLDKEAVEKALKDSHFGVDTVTFVRSIEPTN